MTSIKWFKRKTVTKKLSEVWWIKMFTSLLHNTKLSLKSNKMLQLLWRVLQLKIREENVFLESLLNISTTWGTVYGIWCVSWRNIVKIFFYTVVCCEVKAQGATEGFLCPRLPSMFHRESEWGEDIASRRQSLTTHLLHEAVAAPQQQTAAPTA